MESCSIELTPVEKIIAKGLCIGYSNKEIAAHSSIGISSVKEGVAALTHKFNVANRTALAVYLVLLNKVQVTTKELHSNAMSIFLFFALGLFASAGLSTGDNARPQQRPPITRTSRREVIYV